MFFLCDPGWSVNLHEGGRATSKVDVARQHTHNVARCASCVLVKTLELLQLIGKYFSTADQHTMRRLVTQRFPFVVVCSHRRHHSVCVRCWEPRIFRRLRRRCGEIAIWLCHLHPILTTSCCVIFFVNNATRIG